jgi:hypothetical protein
LTFLIEKTKTAQEWQVLSEDVEKIKGIIDQTQEFHE